MVYYLWIGVRRYRPSSRQASMKPTGLPILLMRSRSANGSGEKSKRPSSSRRRMLLPPMIRCRQQSRQGNIDCAASSSKSYSMIDSTLPEQPHWPRIYYYSQVIFREGLSLSPCSVLLLSNLNQALLSDISSIQGVSLRSRVMYRAPIC